MINKEVREIVQFFHFTTDIYLQAAGVDPVGVRQRSRVCLYGRRTSLRKGSGRLTAGQLFTSQVFITWLTFTLMRYDMLSQSYTKSHFEAGLWSILRASARGRRANRVQRPTVKDCIDNSPTQLVTRGHLPPFGEMYTIQPKAGDIVLFPSWLVHEVWHCLLQWACNLLRFHPQRVAKSAFP